MTFSGNINGSGSVTQSGGGTLILSGSNGHSGGTLVTGTGMLQVASSAALGTGTITLQTANTGLPNTVLFLTSGMTISNPIVLSQPNANRNIITFNSGNSTLSGPITITGAGNNVNVISNNSGTSRLTISGNITGTAFAGSVSFRGGMIDISGTVNMPGAGFDLNSSGTTTVQSTGNVWNYTSFNATNNALRVGANDALATNAVVQFANAATGGGIDLNGFNQSLPGFYNTTGSTSANRIYNNGAGTSTLTLAGLGADRWSSAALADGTGGGKLALVMNSVGRTQTLASATSNYSGGTTILAGTLAQGAANALGLQPSPSTAARSTSGASASRWVLCPGRRAA
ncbi:MAG: hypothetical protein EBR28_14620 [Planctomycetia bacterium]|nr:hypothetical protein [Planctomycetia bacterium]